MDTLDIGTVHFPTGTILACDPLIELEDALPYIQTVPAGTYPVTICVVPNENYGNRYACVKVYISNKKPIRYEIGMVGNEDLDEEIKEDEFFGFFVDAGMGCIADIQDPRGIQEVLDTARERRRGHRPPITTCSATCWRKTSKPIPNIRGMEATGSIGRCQVRTVISSSSLLAGGMESIPVISAMTPEDKVCSVYIHFIDIEKRLR